MRRSFVMTVIVWGIAVGTGFADCPSGTKPSVKPEPRSGTLVVIDVDFCPAPPSPSGATGATGATRATGATGATAGPTAGVTAAPPTGITNLYTQWKTLPKQLPPPGAAAAPGAAPAAGAIGDAFTTIRNVLSPPSTEELKGARIDERDRVAIKLTHFNFINFGAEYTIDKTVIEAYVTLNKLWSQVLGLGANLAAASVSSDEPCPANATFQQCVVDWMWAQTLTSRQLNTLTSAHNTKVALDDSIIQQEIMPESTAMQTLRAQLVQIQSNTLARKPESMQEIEWYNQVQTGHDKLVGQIDAYLRLAELTVSGQTKNIDKQPAGTLVTVKITAMSALGNPAGTPVEIQYFVHSKLPVTFHAGYLYSSLKDVTFAQVRTISGADLFQQVQNPESVNTYAAFLSYKLLEGNRGRYSNGLYATLGTDFKEPGSRLYIGGSIKFLSRVYIGGGVSSATVSEGVNPVVEQIGNTLGARELFTAISTRRDWKPYFQLSFGVFN